MTICESGKEYHTKAENEEKQRGKLMQKGASILDNRAKELLDSGEVETYKEGMEKAMEEYPQAAKAYLAGIGG